MAQIIADRRDIEFVLYEMMNAEYFTKQDKFGEFTKKIFDMIISEARSFAIKEILPTNKEGDNRGVDFNNGNVRAPECFRRPFKLFVEGQWSALAENPAYGGQGLPNLVSHAICEYLNGANYSLTTYPTMGVGTGNLIENYGTEKQKKLFVENLYTSRWGGTMCLTEPQAGTDVGALTTTAQKNSDGTYSISGNKIFITVGEHDLVENIIHAVLARVEGAPEGVRGISCFIIPKIWVDDDGHLGEMNDVVCTGVEEKMGMHGLATCSLEFGGQARCRGLLLGEENKGLLVMFQLINSSRLEVGAQGLWHASTAYLYALNYAKERIQGKDLADEKKSNAVSVPIIRHPDVSRMLLWMKAYVEGMRSFIYYVASCFDKAACAGTDDEKNRLNNYLGFLTPLVKAYCSDRGLEVCMKAMEVYGGYGYIRDYPTEQLVRDCKLATIYEGTNGIQAIDFLKRKIGMKNGSVREYFIKEIQQTIILAKQTGILEKMALKVENAVLRLEKIAQQMVKKSASPDIKIAFAHATPLLEVTGDVIMAWMHLWRAVTACDKLKAKLKKIELYFYEGQLKTAEYFIFSLLPITMGKMDAIEAAHPAAVDIMDNIFRRGK